MTFDELVLLAEAEMVDLDATWDDHKEDLIARAQIRIERDIDLNASRVEETMAANGSELYLPAELIILQQIRLVNGDYLLQKDKGFLREYWPDPSVEGTPRFYAFVADDRILLAPTPGPDCADVEVAYTERLPRLSASRQTNWLTLYTPDLIQYSLMLELSIWTKDAELYKLYSERYSRALNSVAMEYNLRKRTDEYRRGEPKARPSQ